jgi:lysophospholipase L1-like esterase
VQVLNKRCILWSKAPNVLWRLQHGEMPLGLRSKVFWLHVGTNDLARGGCSEEAVFLGILRLADEIHYHHPDAVIVIQGILPRTSSKDGSLETTTVTRIPHLSLHSHGDHERAHSALEARRRFQLWPSIQNINQQLAAFCEEHPHLIYFDADELFLGSMGNEHYRAKGKVIIADLMPDMIHPSFEGYNIMAKAINKELERIIFDHNEANDIEVKDFS